MGIRRGFMGLVKFGWSGLGGMEGKASLKDTRLHLVYKYIMGIGKVTLEAGIQE